METDFYMMIGLSGSGKSTASEQLKKLTVEEENKKVIILSSDDLREELFNDVNEQSKNEILFNEMNRRTIKILKEGVSVIYDATNLQSKKRVHLLKQLPKEVKKHCIILCVPFEKCIERQDKRERKVPSEIIIKQMKSFQVPCYGEGWDDIDFMFYSLYSTDLELLIDKAKLIKQKSPYHKLTIGDHCIAAATKYLFDIGAEKIDKNIFEALYYHDLGKIYTKKYKSEKNRDTFYSHENVSTYLFLSHPPKHLQSISEIYEIAILIQYHMKKLTDKTFYNENSKIRKLLGDEIMDKLIIMAKYDEAAKEY